MKRQRIGIVTGLAGNLLLGWGLYNIMGFGSCGGQYPPCPSGTGVYVAAVPVGMIVSILSIFAGGGFLFLTAFGTVGVASILRGLNGGVGPEGDTVFPLVFGGIFLLPVLLPLFFIPLGKKRVKRAERLVAEGKKAIATVTAVQDTGVTVNNDPRVRLTLSIQPEDGGHAFEGEKAMIVSRVAVPRVGDRYPAWFDAADPKQFGIGTDVEAAAPAHVRALFAKAAKPVPLPAEPAAPAPETEWVTELGRLNDLRMAGGLTDEEFTRAKDRLLAGSPPAPAGG